MFVVRNWSYIKTTSLDDDFRYDMFDNVSNIASNMTK